MTMIKAAIMVLTTYLVHFVKQFVNFNSKSISSNKIIIQIFIIIIIVVIIVIVIDFSKMSKIFRKRVLLTIISLNESFMLLV